MFRQRDEDARVAQEKAQIDRSLAEKMKKMQLQLGKQQRAEKRQKERIAREKDLAEAAAREMTVGGKEAKNDAFMKRVTKTNETLLDPTSQLGTLHASKHMTVKDWKFGLGLGKDPDILTMMEKRNGSRLEPEL